MSAPSTIGRAFFQAWSGWLLAAPSTSDRGRPLRACSSTGNQPTCPPPKSIGCPLREGMATSLRAAEGKVELGQVWDFSPRAGPWSLVTQETEGREWEWDRFEWDGRGVQWESGRDTYGTPEHTLTHSNTLSNNRVSAVRKFGLGLGATEWTTWPTSSFPTPESQHLAQKVIIWISEIVFLISRSGQILISTVFQAPSLYILCRLRNVYRKRLGF